MGGISSKGNSKQPSQLQLPPLSSGCVRPRTNHAGCARQHSAWSTDKDIALLEQSAAAAVETGALRTW